jgi:hypothetical protein
MKFLSLISICIVVLALVQARKRLKHKKPTGNVLAFQEQMRVICGPSNFAINECSKNMAYKKRGFYINERCK